MFMALGLSVALGFVFEVSCPAETANTCAISPLGVALSNIGLRRFLTHFFMR